MNADANEPRPPAIADEIAWESSPPRTLREAVDFIRHHLSPESVFSLAELAGCESWGRFMDLEDRLEDAEWALGDARSNEFWARAEVEALRRQLEEARREIACARPEPAGEAAS